jgi:hypothetical protein
MRKSVVLPAPFGPMTPTMPPRGSEKFRSSMSSLSPNAFLRCSASTTSWPRRSPGGMRISVGSTCLFFSSASSVSYASRRALLFA